MTLAIVQSKLVTGSGSGVADETYSFDSNITAGNTVLVFMRPVYGGAGFLARDVTSNSGATVFTEITACRQRLGVSTVTAYHYNNHPGGVTGIRMQDPGADDFWSQNYVWLLEISGNTPVFDVAVSNAQASPGSNATDGITSTNLTPGNAAALLFGWTNDVEENGGTLSDGTGFTNRVSVTSILRGESLQLASASAVAATFTHTTVANGHITAAVSIRETISASVAKRSPLTSPVFSSRILQ